jgi:NCAIR mutase (PurE)-related protein
MEKIRNNTPTNSQTSRTSDTSQESKDNQRIDIWSKSTSDLPHAEEDVRARQNVSPSINFGEWC